VQILAADPIEAPVDSSSQPYDVAFTLESPPYLPLATRAVLERGDPVDGLLAALLGVRSEERVWPQILVCGNRQPEWLPEARRRLKMERQRGFLLEEDGRSASLVPSSQTTGGELRLAHGFLFLFALMGGLALAALLAGGATWTLAASGAALIAGVGAAARRLRGEEDTWQGADFDLVRERVVSEGQFLQVSIRARVWAGSARRARQLLARLNDALGQYAVTGGNRLVPADHALSSFDPWPLGWAGAGLPQIALGAGELDVLWQPPVRGERLSSGGMAVSGVEMRAPDPAEVTGFYELGRFFRPDGETEPVFVGEATLARNILMIGKPGAGKTNTMTHLALASMRHSERPAIVIIDRHADMASHLYGAIPREHMDRVRVMDLGDEDYALTFNPLNPQRAGWDVESAAGALVDIGQELWGKFWGPPMQDVTRYAFQALATANQRRALDDQFVLSLVAPFLTAGKELQEKFLRAELAGSPYLEGLLA
jgi:hypothetical protein